MTFEEWWAKGGRDYLMFHPNVKVYAAKAWDAALATNRTCQECADAAEWHRAILEETCGEEDLHCACVPVLRQAVQAKTEILADCEVENVRLRKEIARLTAEVDRLTGYSDRLNGLRERLEDSNAQLTAERDALQRDLDIQIKRTEDARNERDALETATSKVVEEAHRAIPYLNPVYCLAYLSVLREALADPTIVALRRE